MKAFVVGCGSIGTRHVANLRTHGIDEILVFDPSAERAGEVVRLHQAKACGVLEDGFASGPDIALICSPPHLHIAHARGAVAAGCHVFIEKPLAHTLSETDDFLREATHAERVVQVGYNLRFDRALADLKRMIEQGVIGPLRYIQAEFGQYLPDWRPQRDYRDNYTAHASWGGGIILDGSHELDYIRWIGGEVEAVSCRAGNLSSLEMDAEDTAEITLRLAGNRIAHVHLDCIRRDYTRRCTIVGELGTLEWDLKGPTRHFDAASGRWIEHARSGELNDMYLDEIGEFLSCARGHARPRVTGESGKRVLEIALAAQQSAREGHEVQLCQQ